MIELLLISLAAILKALNDTLAWHFDTSIFRARDRNFWAINVVTKRVRRIFNYPLDAWHLSNSLQIATWLALAVIYKPYYGWKIDYAIAGVVFIVVFNLFYNKLFLWGKK